MLVESFGRFSRWFLIAIPICIAIAIYPVPFDGKQLIQIDAPLQVTFDVLEKHLWQLHPFIVQVKTLNEINATTSSYQITDHLTVDVFPYVNFSSTYHVLLNIDRNTSCLTSEIQTPWKIMQAYHQYCLHINTLKPTTTIITDQFHGQSWMIFMSYIRMTMLQSHRSTLEKLRKELMIYSLG